MKTLFAGVFAASAIVSASAAVVNWSWTAPGDGGTTPDTSFATFSGQITYTGVGQITQANVTSMTWNISGSVADASGTVNLGSLAISFQHGATSLDDATGLRIVSTGNFGERALVIAQGDESPAVVGATGVGSWNAINDNFDFFYVDGPTNLTLTPVPEPEAVAMVAGLGLVAFGAARRKFSKR